MASQPQPTTKISSSSSPHRKRNVFLFCTAGIVVLILLALAIYQAHRPSGGEADRFASKFWDDRLTNCGGSYYVWEMGPSSQVNLMQYQNPSIWVSSVGVSEADRLNGYEWVGTTGINSSSWRTRLSSNKWPNYMFKGGVPVDKTMLKFGPWWDWINGTPTDAHQMRKFKGQWHVTMQSERSFAPTLPLRVDCSFTR
jgi:hypothetical protein